MMNKTQATYLIADESLGGLMREYTETDREASVGDFVVVAYSKSDRFFTVGKAYEVICDDTNGEITIIDDMNDEHVLSFVNYKTLSPTDIIHVDGERFRMVDRKAEIGERVVIVKEGTHAFMRGKITEIIEVSEVHKSQTRRGDSNYGWLYEEEYRVLGPAEAKFESEALTEVTTANASEQVIAMLANLSRRIVALEAENKRQNDELDTLHRNNVRLGEELERYRAEAKAPATTEVDAVDFSGFIDSVADAVADRIAKGLSR